MTSRPPVVAIIGSRNYPTLDHMSDDLAAAIAWLQRSRDSKSPSVAKLHANALLPVLDELDATRQALAGYMRSHAGPLEYCTCQQCDEARTVLENTP